MRREERFSGRGFFPNWDELWKTRYLKAQLAQLGVVVGALAEWPMKFSF